LHYLTRDLSKLVPYNIPIIIFNYDQFGSVNENQSDKKGMYFTTKDIWYILESQKKLPKETTDPEKVIASKFRYYKFYEVT
jgi:hypothetical protein